MKRQSILFVLLLLQVLLIYCGCSSDSSKGSTEAAQFNASTGNIAAPAEDSAETAEAAIEEASLEEAPALVEDATGIFEGLEDNHTALFSFDGAENVFHFEDEQVRNVLYEAVSGSSYTLSYRYDDSVGYVIYEISE